MNLRKFLWLFLLLASVGGLAVLLLLTMPKVQRGGEHGEQFISLEKELASLGSELLVVTAPYRQRRWRDTEGQLPKIRRGLATVAFLRGLKQTGANHLNLKPAFAQIYDDDINYRDPVHISEQGSRVLGPAILELLQEHLRKRDATPPKRIVIAGDCFSEDIVSALQTFDPETEYLAARAFDDSNKAIQLVFKFRDVYLSETDLVIWLRPEIFVVYNPPPTLDLTPLTTGADSQLMNVNVETDLGYSYYEFDKIRPQLEYPNAAVEIAATTQKGESVILCAYAAIDRQRTNFEAIKTGDALVLTAQPLDSYLAENPKEAGAYYFRREDDILAPR